ncbi:MULTISPECIES: hemophore-related protein [unclassified Mycobacterium]|uniref:hemophore-related protein n=1 Tax=unclassified Mycobacterium TaxID=2642494 RepID=UPI0029C91EAE|nr:MULTISPECIES: hemophore-related protein [unclassified Mycobacterium]
MKSPLLLGLTMLALTVVPQAAAEPGDGPLIATTCSYAQFESALKVQAPNLAAELASRPAAQAKLQELIDLPVDQRKQRLKDVLDRNPQWRSAIEEKRNTPEGQEKVAMLARIAETCHDY